MNKFKDRRQEIMINHVKEIIKFIYKIYLSRSLLISIAINDFQKKFAGSYFGVLWAFTQPLLTILVYFLVFQYGFRSGDIGEFPFLVWFICGIVPWLYIADCISSASSSFLEYSFLVKKVVFNIDILPLVKIISSFIIHGVFILIVLIVCSLSGIYPSIYTIQIIYYIFCMMIFLFSLNLIFSSLMVFFRDLNQIISIILLIGMWGSPIAWNLSVFSERTQFWLKLNPIVYFVEGYRDSFFNNIWFWEKYNQTIYFWGITSILFFIGSTIYLKLKIHLADVL